jgi:two-component system OmpR family sensor kinase
VSLRRRLLVIVVVLSGVVLVAVDVVTYTALQSFLVDRVDRQVIDSVPAAKTHLAAISTGGSRRLGNPLTNGTPPTRTTTTPSTGTAPSGDAAHEAPAGTYEALVTSGGIVDKTAREPRSGKLLVGPNLPDDLAGLARSRRIVEVPAVTGSVRYRLLVTAVAGPTDQHIVVAIPTIDVEDTLAQLRNIEIVATIVALLAILGIGAWAIRVGLRPLDRMRTTATAITGGDLSQRVEPDTQKTEIGRLGASLNAMLAQIEHDYNEREASEGRMRRFLGDASHELRTPIASIRGYAEAFRIGATSDPEDLGRAMRRIEHAAERMGVLVDDLLLLARLDAVREVTGQPVDLVAIADDASADASVVAPDRTIAFRASEPVTITADADQVHQVVDNLLRNAVAYTPPDSAIEVAVRRDGDRGVLVVRDHGPGLPDGAAEHVFDRFWRGGDARTKADGAGLGLAIVHAIVTAHGGTATAAAAPGGGASFTITFPAVTDPQEAAGVLTESAGARPTPQESR